MRDWREQGSYYQEVSDYVEETVPQEEVVTGFVLLESEQVVFFDESGIPHEVVVQGQSLLMGREVHVPEQGYRPISTKEAFAILNPHVARQSSRVNDLPTYRQRYSLKFNELIIGLVLVAIIGAAVWLTVNTFFSKNNDFSNLSGIWVWQSNAVKAIEPKLPALKENAPDAPLIRAPMAIALDAKTGEVLYSKQPYRQAPMASTTKIMTALTAINIPGVNLDEPYIVVKADLAAFSNETQIYLKVGEVITFRDLLYGMLLPSGNDAARAIARYAGAKLLGTGDPYNRFVERMNQQAAAYGLKNSHFTNPHGLDEAGHFSSPFDLAIMGKYLLENPTLSQVVSTVSYKAGEHSVVNGNRFLNNGNGANGIKPGFTDGAQYCLVSSATRNGRTIITVVMGADAAAYNSDPLTLTNYGFKLRPS